jgi:hypothetical protein
MTQDPDFDVPDAGEQVGDPGADPGPEPAAPQRVRTDVPRVDDVIRSVEELEERPIEEHVGVFESAQVQLRRALDDAADAADAADADAADVAEPDDHPEHA